MPRLPLLPTGTRVRTPARTVIPAPPRDLVAPPPCTGPSHFLVSNGSGSAPSSGTLLATRPPRTVPRTRPLAIPTRTSPLEGLSRRLAQSPLGLCQRPVTRQPPTRSPQRRRDTARPPVYVSYILHRRLHTAPWQVCVLFKLDENIMRS